MRSYLKVNMRILHYFLGFPPYRSGGLTRYAYSLMTSQASRGDTVMGLWPGRSRLNSTPKTIRHKDIHGIQNYEIVNPLPVPLDEGIKDTSAFMKDSPREIWISFIKERNVDVIHVHTLMGLYKEFLEAANALNVHLVFTTHDYFGLCPKVTFYKDKGVCTCHHHYQDCVKCNETALSLSKIRIIQSPLYRCVKDSYVIKTLRKGHRKKFFSEEGITTERLKNIEDLSEKYAVLKQYYISMFLKFDMIHFNSELTRSVYMNHFTPKYWKVLSITHQDIQDNRNVENIPSDILRLTCLAPAKPFKGFNVMKNTLDALWNAGKRNFKLNLFGQVDSVSPYMYVQEEGFTHNQLKEIMQDTDVVLVPSIWYETFGFTVLEALSYGVPVIVSDHVGAKDLIHRAGIIVEAGSEESLRQAIESLTKEKVQTLRDETKKLKIKTWNTFLCENDQLYKRKEEIF